MKNGLRTSSEWPASEEMGIRVCALGKRVEKTRGDQAPEVMRRRVHGTVFVSFDPYFAVTGGSQSCV